MGFCETSLTKQASPDLTNLGDCKVSSGFVAQESCAEESRKKLTASMVLPVRRSIFSMSSENLHAMWAVWQSRLKVSGVSYQFLLACP